MRKEAGMPRVERWLWRGQIVLYVPLMILGPLMGMFGEAYIGQANPAMNMLPGVLILLSAALLALNAGREGRFLLRDVSFGSFGVAMLIGLAVLAVITEGDALDGLDAGFDLPDGGQPTKKNRAEGYITR